MMSQTVFCSEEYREEVCDFDQCSCKGWVCCVIGLALDTVFRGLECSFRFCQLHAAKNGCGCCVYAKSKPPLSEVMTDEPNKPKRQIMRNTEGDVRDSQKGLETPIDDSHRNLLPDSTVFVGL